MKAWELKKLLADVDDDMTIVVRWYEWGYDGIGWCSKIEVQESNVDEEWNKKERWRWCYSEYDEDDWYEKKEVLLIW